MLLSQVLLPFLGIVPLASGYNVTGGLERLLYYYTYRLDHITTAANSRRTIANGVPDGPSPISLDEFLYHLHPNDEQHVHVSANEFPDLVESAMKINELGLAGRFPLHRVLDVGSDKIDVFFTELGNLIKHRMSVAKVPGGSTKLNELRTVKKMAFDSLNRVYNARVQASYDSFEHDFQKNFQSMFPDRQTPKSCTFVPRKGRWGLDFEETSEQCEGLSQEDVRSLWNNFKTEGHGASLAALGQSLDDVEDVRMQAVRDSFQPFSVRIALEEGRDLGIDVFETIRENPHIKITQDELWNLWLKHLDAEKVVHLEKSMQLMQRFEAAKTSFELAQSRPVVLDGLLSVDFEAMAGNGTGADEVAMAWNRHLDEHSPATPKENFYRRTLSARAGNPDCDPLKKPSAVEPGTIKNPGAVEPGTIKNPGAVEPGTIKNPGEEKPAKPSPEAQKTKLKSAAENAELVSQKEFSELSARHKTSKFIPKEWRAKVKSFTDVRTALLKHKPLLPSSTKLKAVTGLNGGALGNGLWVAGVVYSFVSNSTALDKVAAVTSIVPFVGCTTGAVAALEQGQDETMVSIDTSLCLLGDALILAGQPIAALAVYLARFVISQFQPPPKTPTNNETLTARDALWANFINANVYRYMYSHDYRDPHQAFASKLNNTLAVTAYGVLAEAADTIAAINVTSSDETLAEEPGAKDSKSAKGSKSAKDSKSAKGSKPAKVKRLDANVVAQRAQEAMQKVREAATVEVSRQQRDFLFTIPTNLNEGKLFQLRDAGQEFNKRFIERMTSKENVEHHSDSIFQFWVKKGLEILAGNLSPVITELKPTSWDRHEDATKKLSATGEYIATQPVKMPSSVSTAFVLGQSKGLAALDQDTLSAQGYIRQIVRDALGRSATEEELPTSYVDMLAIRHASDVVDAIAGQKKEEQISTIFPLEGAARQNLHLLLAMKCGRLYEERKVAGIEEERQKQAWVLSSTAPSQVIDPIFPPMEKPSHKGRLLKMMLGMPNDLPASQYEGSDDALVKDTQKIASKIKGAKKRN